MIEQALLICTIVAVELSMVAAIGCAIVWLRNRWFPLPPEGMETPVLCQADGSAHPTAKEMGYRALDLTIERPKALGDGHLCRREDGAYYYVYADGAVSPIIHEYDDRLFGAVQKGTSDATR